MSLSDNQFLRNRLPIPVQCLKHLSQCRGQCHCTPGVGGETEARGGESTKSRQWQLRHHALAVTQRKGWDSITLSAPA